MAQAVRPDREKKFADDLPEALRSDGITATIIHDNIWRPPNRENNWCAFCMVGREGSGKSYTTASILEKSDPSFDADRVFFDPVALMEFIAGLEPEERTGKAVMLDEAGVGMGVRSWYDEDQIKVNKAAQTMRDDNMILGSTLPSFDLMDSQLRTRHHGFCEMWGKDDGTSGTWSWKNIVVNREEGGDTIKRKEYPRLHHGGRTHRVTRLRIGPPSESFVETYEERKREFKQAYYEEVVESAKKEDDDIGPKEAAAEIITGGDYDLVTTVNGNTGEEYIDRDKLHLEFEDRGLTHRGARAAKKIVEEEWAGDES